MITKIARHLTGWTLAAGVVGGALALSINPQVPPASAQIAPKATETPSGSRETPHTPAASPRRSESLTASQFAALALKAKYASGKPNMYSRWYASQGFAKDYARSYGFSVGLYKSAPWCAMFVSYLTHKAHVWTPSDDALAAGMADEYRRAGRLKSGPSVGSLAFFDWSGNETLGGISHVGIVVGYTAHSVKVVEGNAGDHEVRTTWRKRNLVTGYGLPKFSR